MNAVALTEHYRNVLTGRELPGSGLGWLDERRQKAFDAFSESGFPTTRNEDWKYTKVTAIEKRLFQPSAKQCIGLDVDDIEAHLIEGLDCYRLVFVNGEFMPMLSSRRSELPQGFTVASLARVLADDPAAVEPYLGTIASPKANGFAALNAAEMGDGACIILPKDEIAEKPVHVLYLTTAQEDEIVAQPRNLIVAGEGAQVVVIESYSSLGKSGYLTNAVTEVSLAANSSVSHYKLQDESEKAWHIATLQAEQARDSRFKSSSVSLGALLARNDINTVLGDEGADCSLDGLYITHGRQHVDFHTSIDHAKPHCTSNEFYKGVLDGGSRGVFNGKVFVHPDAQKTDSAQSNANLLLSDKAEVDTKPQLEIYADDVKCAHGATVGQLDDTAIFYLRSRGLDMDAARSLLTYAFAGEMIERIGVPEWHDKLKYRVLAALPGGESIRGLL